MNAAGAQTTRPLSRVDRARFYHPAQWQRIRGACKWAARDIDLDEHAAGIVEMLNQPRKRR